MINNNMENDFAEWLNNFEKDIWKALKNETEDCIQQEDFRAEESFPYSCGKVYGLV